MSGSPFSIRLARGALMRVRDAAGSTVSAQAGTVWITEENSVRDVLLRAGESSRLRTGGLAIVEAWTDAAISFSPEAT
jgi:hypothetical protein